MRIGIGQINPTVGDLEGNAAKIIRYIGEAQGLGVDLLTFPELAVTGYPPEDLLFKPQFISRNRSLLDAIVQSSSSLAVVIGFVDRSTDIHNAAAVAYDRRLVGIYHKAHLPTYGVFAENRYFQPGTRAPVFIICGIRVGVTIYEDMWYETGPAAAQAHAGAEVLVNIGASPYHAGKTVVRERMLSTTASDNQVIVVHSNLVGGQDELVFDGNSLVIGAEGEIIARGSQFEEELMVADLDIEAVRRSRLHTPRQRGAVTWIPDDSAGGAVFEVSGPPPIVRKQPLPPRHVRHVDGPAEVYEALVLGTRDYTRKNGFEKVVIGLSGGIDSSLVAAIAVDALGADNVVGVSMPSRYSSPGSESDAAALALNLGIEFKRVPIEPVFDSYERTLADSFQGMQPDVTEENLQARIRATILYAFSNKFRWLVLGCSNKSELATGFGTLHGDMAAGFFPLKDVFKTAVFELARHRNRQPQTELIPRSVLSKAPSAELRPDQKDVDSLPPYDVLDPILKAYVEEDATIEQITAMGFDPDTIAKTARLVDRSEYKRRQIAPGVRITPRDFGKDRRLPITNLFRER